MYTTHHLARSAYIGKCKASSKVSKTMNSLCRSMVAVMLAMSLILSLGVIMSQARAYPSSSLVSKMSQSFQSPSRPLYHKEGQKSTQEPVAAANLRMIPTSRPNPATAVIASNKLRRIPPSRSNPTQNM